MYQRSSLLWVLIAYSSAAVFVTVSGQPTTDDVDDIGLSLVPQLVNTVATLQTALTKLEVELAKAMVSRKYQHQSQNNVCCS